jgi:hypothetical protein
MKIEGITLRHAAAPSFLSLFFLAAMLAACAKLPDDGASAVVKRFEGLRTMRYCELFLIGGDAAKNLKAAFYNTTGLNNEENARDSCPAALWDKADPEALRKQYRVLSVFKNGPRYWAMDWIELPVGTQRDFDGVQARWMGKALLPKGVNLGQKGSSAYQPTTVARNSKMGFSRGQPVFIVDGPDGMPWVMQAYSRIVDPRLTYQDLQTLDTKLKPAPGWKYRVKVLDADLEISAVNGVARIVQDDLENTYDACFENAGQKSCNILP